MRDTRDFTTNIHCTLTAATAPGKTSSIALNGHGLDCKNTKPGLSEFLLVRVVVLVCSESQVVRSSASDFTFGIIVEKFRPHS